MKIKVIETITEIEATAQGINASQTLGGRLASLLANALTPYRTYDEDEEDDEAGRREGMSDLISRQAVIDALEKIAELFPWRVPGKSDTYDSYNEAWNDAIGRAEMEIESLPSAQPYTEDELQTIQDMEQAELEKAFELGQQDAQPELDTDGTLHITVDTDISAVRRVLVAQEGTQYGNMYYADEPQWIPCSERLPEKSGRYLVTNIQLGAYHVDWNNYYVNGEGHCDGWLWEQGCTAWMPLPEPWRGEE